MLSPEPALAERLARSGQDHLLRHWHELEPEGRERLRSQIEALDFDRLDDLIRRFVLEHDDEVPGDVTFPPDEIGPVEVDRIPETDAERSARRRAAERGEEALAAGEVAAVMVAGGQGTRLGFDGPKGTYPIGPVSGASLFQIHAEKLLGLGRRHGRSIPLYVMTSPENHDETVAFFETHGNFGLDAVRFFVQGQLPAVDRRNGKILLADRDRLALSPDGHGGTILALAAGGPDGRPSCLDEMADRGIRTLFYFQVDNPLVQICDPSYLGIHLAAEAEISFKIVEKVRPDEKVGVVVRRGDRALVIEYSDLPPALAERREADGRLQLWAGSIAIHCFDLAFLRRLSTEGGRLPEHRALKKVPHLDDRGALIEPSEPNAVKFETFIFDALPLADRFAIVETDRPTEFEPLKNASGPDSPASVRQRMSDLSADWLEQAGVRIERRSDGTVPFGIEISPLFALSPSDLKGKVEAGSTVDRPTLFAEAGASAVSRSLRR